MSSLVKQHGWTLSLAFALAVGLAWLYLHRDDATQNEIRGRDTSAFPVWRREDLSRFELVHEDETLILERDAKNDSTWKMVAPRAGRADQAAVERLLTTLEFASVVRKTTAGAQLGFDKPRAAGKIAMRGYTVTFVLGAPSPRPEGSSYFKVNDGEPFVVSKEVTEALLRESDVYRDRTVVPYLSIDLARVEVRRPGGGFVLERADERTFKVASEGVMASRVALDQHVWGAFAEMRAEAFPREIENQAASSSFTIVLTPKDGKKPIAELAIGGECPGHPDDVVVVRKMPTPVAACAPKGAAESLKVAPKELVDKKPFTFRADEIEELILERTSSAEADADASVAGGAGAAPRTIEIARKSVGWHERAPSDRDLSGDEADAASELVTRIAGSEALDVARAGSEAFTPLARATVRSGNRDEVVDVGTGWIKRRLDGARLEVPPSLIRLLTPRETSLRPRALLGEAKRITRVTLRCGAPQELADKGEGFRMVEPAGYEADASITQLLDAVTRGKVDLWIADAPDPSFGLDAETCKVVFGYEGDSGAATLVIGKYGEGGVYGRVDTKSGVFVAPFSLQKLASQVYVSRASLRVPRERIEGLKVTHDGKPAAGVDLEAAKDAVAALYADRVVALGKTDAPRPILIDVSLGDGGGRHLVACSDYGVERTCTTTDVNATFGVAAERVHPFFPLKDDGGAGAPDAGALATDGGSR